MWLIALILLPASCSFLQRHSVKMPRIICTGYEITDALRKYLEVGHGVDFDKDLATDSEDDDELDEINSNVDPQKLAMQREAEIVMSYQGYFRSIRNSAPPEIRKTLEIPYSEYVAVASFSLLDIVSSTAQVITNMSSTVIGSTCSCPLEHTLSSTTGLVLLNLHLRKTGRLSSHSSRP